MFASKRQRFKEGLIQQSEGKLRPIRPNLAAFVLAVSVRLYYIIKKNMVTNKHQKINPIKIIASHNYRMQVVKNIYIYIY